MERGYPHRFEEFIMSATPLRIFIALVLALTTFPALAEDKPVQPRTIAVAVGQSVRVQMTSKRPIKSVFNDHENVVRVQPVPDDPTTIVLTGLAPGRARLTLKDVDGREEVRDLGRSAGK
jgi:hypothetical protein